MAAFTRKQYSGAARNTTTTTLLTSVGTTVDIAATTGWPSIAGIPFYVVLNPSSIYEEKCLATISGSTLTLVRAQDDTTASEHPIGSVIYPVFTANDADEANELVSKLTTKGDLLVTDGNGLYRLGVGANGYFLKANSSASVGVEWASIPTINNLDDVGDVTISTVEDGDFLVYNSSASAWVNETVHFLTVSDTAPNDEVTEGDLWYNSLELELYTYYSSSWIQVTETQSGPQELYELIDVLIDDPEYGQTLVYNGTEWENSVIQSALTLETARAISLSGDVSGSVAFDGSQDVSISATIQPNSVALGTDTTGSYVQSLVAGTGVTLSNNSGESSTPTIAIGQAVGTSASVSFAHVATDSLNVVNNVIGTGNITLTPNVSSYVIGDTGPAGGKIFITPSTSGNTTGKYFEVAPIAGEVIRTWATDTDPGIGLGNAATTVSGADGTDIGTGQQNTADIVAQAGNVAATSAAVYCDQYSYGGFSDWFLPSKDELNELYTQRNIVGGLQVSYYSTSSEYSNDAFWFQSFIDGNPNTPYKNNAYYIRPVRSFVAPAPAGIITGNLTGNVTGNVIGNSSTATTLQTARTISLTGDVSGSVSFDGSQNITIPTTVQINSITLGTDTTGNYMSDLTQGTGVTITHTPSEGSNATIAIGQAVGTSSSVTFANVTSNLIGDVTGNADTATSLETARTISLSGDISGSASFDGTTNINIVTDISGSVSGVDSISGVDFVQFDTTANTTPVAGLLGWDSVEGTLNLGLSTGKHIHVGEESVFRVRNSTGAVISKGTALYASGVESSGRIQVTPYVADGSVREVRFMGLATESINNGVNGFVQHFGYVRDLDTRGTSSTSISVGDETWAAGDILYVHPTAPGKLTNIAPRHAVIAAILIVRHATTGILFVRPSSGGHIEDIHDIVLTSPTDGQFLRYNSASAVWANDAINLGTDTVGNYMSDLTQGTGVTITHTPGEGSNATVAIGQDVGTSASVTFANITATGQVSLPSDSITTTNLAVGAARSGFRSHIVAQQGATHTIAASDVGGLVVLSSCTSVVIPTADGTFTIGDRVDFLQTGSQVVTFSATAPQTVGGFDNQTKLGGQYAVATLVKYAANTWVLVGNITS